MPPIVRFLFRRLVAIPVTFLVITMALYAVTLLAPPVVRATLYLPRTNSNASPEQLLKNAIERFGMDDPYPIQYGRWLVRLFQGDWGYSPIRGEPVLAALLRATPATAELTIYSLFLLVPLGLLAGAVAGGRAQRGADHFFRLAAFLATAMPPFILALVLLTVFYVTLHWFPPERLSIPFQVATQEPSFRAYTGLLTVDGLLNGRWDVTVDALRHLVLPVICLSLVHWATLGRITRALMLEEMEMEYTVAARARGLPERAIVWRHAFPNVLAPALTSTALSAASLVTGVFVIERVFSFHGVSELIVASMSYIPETPMAVGFAVYSVLLVLAVMLALDLLQAFTDPRLRQKADEL